MAYSTRSLELATVANSSLLAGSHDVFDNLSQLELAHNATGLGIGKNLIETGPHPEPLSA